MTSRERVLQALDHRAPDSVPLDLGASATSGMHCTSVYRLRQALGLDEPGTPVKVNEPYQMLGEIGDDLAEALGVDVVGLMGPRTLFGFPNEGWKPWTLHDSTPLLVPRGFTTKPNAHGDILLYPGGDTSAPPSGRMPKDGYYFDSIIRQPPINDEALDPEDNLEEFGPITDDDLDYFAMEAARLRAQGDRAVLANFGGTGFGDIALVPASWLREPKGIRDVEEWYISTITRSDYIHRVFERQCEIGLENLDRLNRRLGEDVDIVFVSGTDFGAQQGLFISVESYRELFRPYHVAVNGWIHEHTQWKTFIHSCGSVVELLGEFIDAGFDILNPVQTGAAGMAPQTLKEQYGDRIVFWGGGIDTQKTLPFGTPEEIREEVARNLEVFAPGGGYVFNAIHNVQAKIPVENLLAFFESFADNRGD